MLGLYLGALFTSDTWVSWEHAPEFSCFILWFPVAKLRPMLLADSVHLSRSVTVGYLIPCYEFEFQGSFARPCLPCSATKLTPNAI